MTLTEMSVAARMCGMSYGQYAFLLRQGKITPPDIEEVHKNMKKSSGKTKVCAECGKPMDDPTGQRKFCSISCKSQYHSRKRAERTAVNNG